MTLGQGVYNKGGDRFEVRLRSTATSNNGTPATQTPQGSLTAGLHHVVYTRDAAGQATVYIDGVVEGQASVGGSLSNWDATMPLLLGNEASGGRPWLGEYKLVAVYARALSAAEVAQNLSAGSEGDGSTVNIPPVAVAVATPQSGAAPLTVTLDGTSSTDIDGTIVDYAWDLGDGTMVSGQSVQHTYNDPGVYTATLTVTDDGGQSAAASTSVQVDTGPFGPVILSQPQDVTVAEGQTALFEVQAEGLPAPTYQWYLDGAPIPGAQEASVVLSGLTLADSGSELASR